MAAGVSKAAVVVVFMTQRYQDSDNCRLELKFAKEKNVPLVPVMMQDAWRPDGWLGLIMAGALWTPLHDEASFEQNLYSLVDQIKVVVPSAILDAKHPTTASPTTEVEHDVQALRAELDGLRQELHTQQRGSAHATREFAAAAGEDSLAPLPAEVPPLSLHVWPTADMAKLKAMLLADQQHENTMAVTSQKAKVGALGMGGIGSAFLSCPINSIAFLFRQTPHRHLHAIFIAGELCG